MHDVGYPHGPWLAAILGGLVLLAVAVLQARRFPPKRSWWAGGSGSRRTLLRADFVAALAVGYLLAVSSVECQPPGWRCEAITSCTYTAAVLCAAITVLTMIAVARSRLRR